MKKRILSIVLSVFLLLPAAMTACDTAPRDVSADSGTADVSSAADAEGVGVIDLSAYTDTPAEEDYIHAENVFSFKPLPELPDGGSYSTFMYYEDDVLLLRGVIPAGDGTRTACFIELRKDGTVETTPYVYPDTLGELEFGGAFRPEDGGETYLMTTYHGYTYDMTEEEREAQAQRSGSLIRCTMDGEELARMALPGNGKNTLLAILDDGRIVVKTENSFCFFDRDLNLLMEIENYSAQNLMMTPDGALIFQGQYQGSYYRLYPDTQSYDIEAEYVAPQSLQTRGGSELFLTDAETEYDAYFVNDDGMYGWNIGDAEAVELCSFKYSGRTFGSTMVILCVLDADTMLVNQYDDITKKWTLGYLYRDETLEKTPKIRITLGVVDNMERLNSNVWSCLTAAVENFNAVNPEYFIDVVPYYDYIGDMERGVVPEGFTEAMLSGTSADIIVSSHEIREQMQIYADRGAFLDISDALGSVFLPCVRSAYEKRSGAIYAMPMNMNLSVLVTKEAVLGRDSALTPEQLYALEAGHGAGTALFNTINKAALTGIGVPSFADFETGECRYDSEEFASFLQLLDRVETNDGGAVYSGDWISLLTYDYIFSSPDIAEKLREDQITVLEMPFNTEYAYPLLKLLYGEDAFAIHGYPTDGGDLVMFHSDADISVNAQSRVQYGAMQFLAYLLSIDVQSYEWLREVSFPVTREGIERILETEAYYFHENPIVWDERNPYWYILMTYPLSYDPDSKYNEGNNAIEIRITEEDRAILRRLFYETEMQSLVDTTMSAIIEEELSAYRAGVRTLAETQRILQSRLYIYVNE